MSIPKARHEAEHRGDGRGEGQTRQGLVEVVTSWPLGGFHLFSSSKAFKSP